MINNINSWHTAYLDSTEGSYAHVEEDAVQHRHGDELQAAGGPENMLLQSQFRQVATWQRV